MTLLNKESVNRLSPDRVNLPQYNVDHLIPGIVHIGLGAFHRAHQALYTHELMNKTGQTNWGITGVSLFSKEGVTSELPMQDYMYSVLELNQDGSQMTKVCASICKTMIACHNRLPLIELIAQPETRIVSLTITEKGYCLNPANGQLIVDHPMIIHDIEHSEHPISAIGIIVAALEKCFANGQTPFTLMSCDNCSLNGERLRSVVTQLASLTNPKLVPWIKKTVCFPSTMVDRIVPAQTGKEQAQLQEALGLEDHCGIVCEGFSQWVIEDKFSSGRPDWDLIDGVIFTDNVTPYESMKLRMLNGSHSLLAYLGYLGGYKTVYQAICNPDYRTLIKKFLYSEAIPALDAPQGVDLFAYADALIARFSNPYIEHSTWQIAMDGSQKIPQRWLDTVKVLLAKNKPFPCIALGIAGWMHYVSGIDEQGQAIDVKDPMQKSLQKAITLATGNVEKVVLNFLNLDQIFDTELSQKDTFINAIIDAYKYIKIFHVKAGVKFYAA